MNAFPDHMHAVEQQIANRIISTVLKFNPDYHIEVEWGDGPEGNPNTRDRKAIQKETNATDVTVYRVKRPGTDRWINVGHFLLVHGNHSDVYSDYGWAWRPSQEDDREYHKMIMDKLDGQIRRKVFD